MMSNDRTQLVQQLAELRVEHRDLDEVIIHLAAHPASDELRLKRLKRRKLRIKDMMGYVESKLIPDIDA